VQDLDLAEPHLAQQVELVHQRPGRVFLGDVGEDGLAIGLVLQPNLEEFEAVIARAATYVKQVRRTRVRGGRGLGNQLEDQRRVDRG
jgi:hypothetical protein